MDALKNSALAFLVAFLFCVPSISCAVTPPDTVLTNDATVTYADDEGKSYTDNSNIVSLTVSARTVVTKLNVYSDPANPTVADAGATTAPVAPGDTIYVPISYTNGGDAPDKYTMSVYGVVPVDYLVGFMRDDNEDGVHQNEETTERIETTWIDANTTGARGFIGISVPGNAVPDAVVTISTRATSSVDPTGPLGVGYDEVTLKLLPTLITTGPRITVTAQSDKETALPGESYTVTYTIRNVGTDVAQSLSLFVTVPANTSVETSEPGGFLQADGTVYVVPLPQVAAGDGGNVTVTFRVQ